jgi:hypothetical protein
MEVRDGAGLSFPVKGVVSLKELLSVVPGGGAR